MPVIQPQRNLQHMPVWHNALLRNARSFSYWSPPLIRRGVMRWGDLVDNGAIPLLLWDMLAPTWRLVYLEKVEQVVSSYQAALDYKGAELGAWAATWSSRRMLLYMQHRRRHPARKTLEVWSAFQRLYLPRWDKNFITRCLWKKLPVGTRMERLGGKLCPLDSRVETHEHVFRHCFFRPFLFDTVRRAFGLVPTPSGVVEPSRLLHEHPLLSLTTTHGLIL